MEIELNDEKYYDVLKHHIDSIHELNSQIYYLYDDINSLGRELKDSKKRITHLFNENKHLEEELQGSRDRIIDLEGENCALREEIERLRWMAETQD